MIKVPSFGRVGWLSAISATVGIVGDGIAQEFERSKKRETLSVSVPMWIAEKNGLVTRG